MNPADAFLQNLERKALVVAGALAVVAVVLGCFERAWVESAYRLAAFTCLAPAVGSLVLVLIHRTTGGQWTAGLGVFLSRGAAAAPWVWLLTMPVALLPWPAASGHRHLPVDLSYEGLPMVLPGRHRGRPPLHAARLGGRRDGEGAAPADEPAPLGGARGADRDPLHPHLHR